MAMMNLFCLVCSFFLLFTHCDSYLIRNKRHLLNKVHCQDLVLDLTEEGEGILTLQTETFEGSFNDCGGNVNEYKYKQNQNCPLLVFTNDETQMVWTSDEFAIVESVDCMFDFFEIEGTKFCGRKPLVYITNGSYVASVFKSDESNEDRGYTFHIKEQKVDTLTFCNNTVSGNGVSKTITNSIDPAGQNCFYRIEATEKNMVVQLTLEKVNFKSTSCDDESVIIYEGRSSHGEKKAVICPSTPQHVFPFHAKAFFVEYRNRLNSKREESFKIKCDFVEINCLTPTPAPTITSPVWGNNDCGISTWHEIDLVQSRLTKAKSSRPNEDPWYVNFRTKAVLGKPEITFCGGSLISKKYVLTAAHCITDFKRSVGYGEFSKSTVSLSLGTISCLGGGVQRSLRNYTIHPKFDEKNLTVLANDIALVELDTPVEYGDSIRPICLADKTFIDKAFFEDNPRSHVFKTFGRVVGCGRSSEYGPRHETLKSLYLEYVPEEQCEESFSKKNLTKTPSMFCAGSEVARKGDACYGDSGSPYVMYTERSLIQTGIVSWGLKCDVAGFSGVYTHVGLFYDWIKEITNFDTKKIARVATFSEDGPSYIARQIESIGHSFDITFRMKTKQDKALLLYAGNNEQNVGFSVSIFGGKISVITDPGDEKIELMSRVNTYNDGRWHYISILKFGVSLQMNIDDYETLQMIGSGVKNSLNTNTPLYFGYADVFIPENLSATTEQLDGCIGDVTINGEFLNFAVIQPRDRPGTSLAACPIPDPEGPYDREVLPISEPWIAPPTLRPGRCALTVVDPITVSGDDITGTYFGALPNSRMEYDSLTASLRIRSVLSMMFKTNSPDGVIFYFSDAKHTDHISVTMTNGMIRYTFNSGTGIGELMSDNTYNDGQWHMLVLGRSMKKGTMMVDDMEFGPTESRGGARTINSIPPFYIGGIETSGLPVSAVRNLGGVTTGFVGCLSDLKLNGEDLGPPLVQNGTQSCSDLIENGAYFHGDGGYIRLMETFSVGLDLEIKVELRPRSINGVIFSVHGSKGNYVVLQMVKGQIWLTAENGSGAFTSKFKPERNNTLCDGEWHTIVAKKNKNVATLIVDEGEAIITKGGSATYTDTSNPIYLGGNRTYVTMGVRANADYRGCMRNLMINGERQYLATGLAVNDVNVQACPNE